MSSGEYPAASVLQLPRISLKSLCPCIKRLTLLVIERVLNVNGPRHCPLRDANVVEHETDGVRVDTKGGHSGGHGASKVMHAKMVKSRSARARPRARVAACAVIGPLPDGYGNT